MDGVILDDSTVSIISTTKSSESPAWVRAVLRVYYSDLVLLSCSISSDGDTAVLTMSKFGGSLKEKSILVATRRKDG